MLAKLWDSADIYNIIFLSELTDFVRFRLGIDLGLTWDSVGIELGETGEKPGRNY